MPLTLYDMHTHTEHSHDSRQTVDELCVAELAAGVAGVAVTDHSDGLYSHRNGDFERLVQSNRACRAAAERYAGRLEILSGVEIGEELWSPRNADIVRGLADWDVVLASNHGRMEEDGFLPLGQQAYDTWPQERLNTFLRRYLEDLAKTADRMDYDILTHLDVPLRYINWKCGCTLEWESCADVLEEILRIVIRRGKTLEINTSGLAVGWRWMPDPAVLRRYYELGGRRVSIGSDAHAGRTAAVGLAETAAQLRAIGFTGQTIYRKRRPVEIPFEEKAACGKNTAGEEMV